MLDGGTQAPVLKAFARSRQRPVKRHVPALSKVRLFLDEWVVWRFKGRTDHTAKLARAIKTHAAAVAAFSDADLIVRVKEPLRAERLLVPEEGALRFALLIEVIARETGLRLRDNQIACALGLLSGVCIELRTGEGKTLAAALAALAAASVGVSVHVITVNDYLASRDHDLIAPLAKRIGRTSAVILQAHSDDQKRAAYDTEILYGTNKTFVFDHLRDKREAHSLGEAARPRQTGQAFAIVDEADSVLIDDATVPMILSEPAGRLPAVDVALFKHLIEFCRSLALGAERVRDVNGSWRLTPAGIERLAEQARHWRHPVAATSEIIDLAEQGLMAIYGFVEGVAYVVSEGEVKMVDQSTGRLMPDRKWDYGMQQMVELAASVAPTPENRTVGQITQQTFFRQYRLLSGLTGTAKECSGELWAIYDLPVRPVAPHTPSKLVDCGLRVFATAQAKWDALAARALEVATRRAVLIGVNDVAESAALRATFAALGREVEVLDALSEEKEAELVAKAGALGAITIATHLAGRGTDITLDNNVRASGGLHVIIGSVMASGRLERQLYGRAGRQGDPGSYDRMISLADRGLVEGAFSVFRHVMTATLRKRILPAFCLSQIQANRDRRARAMRRRSLLREQDMTRKLGYK